jgi:hypothetical protein
MMVKVPVHWLQGLMTTFIFEQTYIPHNESADATVALDVAVAE